MLPTAGSRPCPCGRGPAYDDCCAPLLRAERLAASPEELMRSRYTAYATGDPAGMEHLWRTWHPRTRPERVVHDPTTTWAGLRVLEAVGDVVEFVAAYDAPGGPGRLHERSRFAWRGGRWCYVGPTIGPAAGGADS